MISRTTFSRTAAAVATRGGEAVARDGFDPLSEHIRRCPHPHYADLVSRSVTPLPAYPNFYAVAGYDEVVEVLMNPDVYNGQPFPDADVPIMSAMRPERHARVRRAVQSLFTKRALISYRRSSSRWWHAGPTVSCARDGAISCRSGPIRSR